jgi:hypothetical protein
VPLEYLKDAAANGDTDALVRYRGSSGETHDLPLCSTDVRRERKLTEPAASPP